MKKIALILTLFATTAEAKQVITVPGQSQDLRETIEVNTSRDLRAGYPALWKTPEWLEAYRLCGQNPFDAPKYQGMAEGVHVFTCRGRKN